MPEKQKKHFEWWWLVLPVVYLLFITFGLPNNLLGSTWPALNELHHFPLTGSTTVYMVISIGNIIASFTSDKLIRALGHAKVVWIGLILTIIAVLGWGLIPSYAAFIVFGLPFGFGAGYGVAATNNYMVDHYKAFHLSMVNCVWAIGSAAGGGIINASLKNGVAGYRTGYIIIGIIVAVVLVIAIINSRHWKEVPLIAADAQEPEEKDPNTKPITMKDAIVIPGVFAAMMVLFFYASIENVNNTVGPTFMKEVCHATARSATLGGTLFFVGLAVGRFITAFVTLKLSDKTLLRSGEVVMLIGVILLIVAKDSPTLALVALAVVGVGCAPINPMLVHSTPENFGTKYSQAAVGLILTASNIGNLLMPKLFSVIAKHSGYGFYPYYVLIMLVLLCAMFELLQFQSKKNKKNAEA